MKNGLIPFLRQFRVFTVFVCLYINSYFSKTTTAEKEIKEYSDRAMFSISEYRLTSILS